MSSTDTQAANECQGKNGERRKGCCPPQWLSVTGGGGRRAGSVVAVARAGYEFAAAMRGNHFHLDGAKGSVAAGVGGIVGQNVLIANVMSHVFADVVHVIDVFREEG